MLRFTGRHTGIALLRCTSPSLAHEIRTSAVRCFASSSGGGGPPDIREGLKRLTAPLENIPIIGGILAEGKRATKMAMKAGSLAASLVADKNAAAVDTKGMEPTVAAEITTASRLAGIDPMTLVGTELKFLGDGVKKLIESNHPLLSTIAQYYFDLEGKKIRPTLVLLIARATTTLPATSPPVEGDDGFVLPSQRRLAEITEMIHTASLIHDDVIDTADTRRSMVSINQVFGNKMAVLAGDFLLARSSLALARLRNVEVIELLSTVIANLVEGEFMQMKPVTNNERQAVKNFEQYLEKSFMKTASLIAHSCKASALLGGHSGQVPEWAYVYGKHVGLAFQLVDDYLDYVSSSNTLGKPAAADLDLGLATAPVLYAAEEYPELNELIQRQFAEAGDAEKARTLTLKSQGLRKTKELAVEHIRIAKEAVMNLPTSPARAALLAVADKVLDRKK